MSTAIPSFNSGDIAWVAASTALVMFMTPGLAFFYGGLVRKRDLVSTLSQCLTIFALVSLVWVFWGYSLVFGPDAGFGLIGNLSKVLLYNITPFTRSTYPSTNGVAGNIPELLVFAFQLKFAAITPALVIGAFAGRIKFRSLIIFIVLWSTFIYSPIAHWIWGTSILTGVGSGWLHSIGAIDFAGGMVVHEAAGMTALAAALAIGKRKDLGLRELKPNNVPFVILGAGLLWFGWFGFNGGSALAADGVAVSAVVVTNLAAAAGALSWMAVDWIRRGKPSAVGLVVGAVCGLAAVTPASGYVGVPASLVIGLVAGVFANLVANWRASRMIFDDTLDVFACHGVSGIWGSLATGLFASTAINPTGPNGLLFGNPHLFLAQCLAVVVVGGFAFFGSYALLKIIGFFTPLRVSPEEEEKGLDESHFGEVAYSEE